MFKHISSLKRLAFVFFIAASFAGFTFIAPSVTFAECTVDQIAEDRCEEDQDSQFSIIPSEVCEGQAAESAACKANVDQGPGNNALTGPAGVLTRVANFLAVVVGIAAVIAIIIGGFKYALSGGDAGKTKEGRDTIIYALVGLVVTVIARQIIIFVVSRL